MSAEIITTLEKAADVLLADPNQVNAEDRRNAEQLFQDAKKEMTIDVAQQIIQSSSNQFVLFQIAQLIGELVLREWAILEQSQVEPAYKALIEYVATRDGLANYVVSEFLRSAAMIIKRGILDKKTGDCEDLFQLIHNLISNPEARLQSVGCQLISAITEQFSTSWRNSKFSITWDFHLNAKTAFENDGLRRLLEMSLQTLHALCSQSDILSNEFEKRLCDKFLEVAENIFSWNFSTRFFRRLFGSNSNSNSFRPPATWQDLLHNDQFFELFFQLHSKVRQSEELSVRSLACLVQLSGLAGECMTNQDFSTHYVQLYVDNLLRLFPEGPMPHEVNHFCSIINRLFLYRPVQSLMRIEKDLRSRFFAYISQYTTHLTQNALTQAIGSSEHGDHASLALLYDAWVIFLHSKWSMAVPEEHQDVVERELLIEPSWNIVCSFLRSVQSAPNGTRPENGEEDDDEDSDDRILFKDLLGPVGQMGCYTLENFMDMIVKALRERLQEFTAMASGKADASRLPYWQEDMHWLLMIIANSIVGEDLDGACHVQGDVYELSIGLMKKRGQPYSAETRVSFLDSCFKNPEAERTATSADVDPFLLVVGELFAWASLEQQLVTSASPEMISPELCRTTLFTLRRVINASSRLPEAEDELPQPQILPHLPHDNDFSSLLVSFCLHKLFTVLSRFSGEEKLCRDAVDLLIGLIESRAPMLASSPDLYEQLASVDIASLPARTSLMKALVLIGAAANDETIRQNMYVKILEPLANRYTVVCDSAQSSSSDSELVDLLQCFDGVAKASESQSAQVLFKFLNPVISRCVPLMKSRAQSQPVISAILTLILDVTTKVSIYVEDKNDAMELYRALIAIVEGYRIEQATRFVGMTSDEEDKAHDLVLFMDILSNILSKDILEDADDRLSTGTQVAIHSLEMLLYVMSESVLEMPEVATKFYRLILYLVEFSPESMASMSPQLLNSLCECLKAGMTSKFGVEITSHCLESFAEVAMFFSNNRERTTALVMQQFHDVLPLVFETCLETSCEQSVFSDACSCLFSLICFDKDVFDRFVMDLLSRKSNQAASAKLQEAFGNLFPSPPTPGRRERIQFRQRMEKFLNGIQGLLSCH